MLQIGTHVKQFAELTEPMTSRSPLVQCPLIIFLQPFVHRSHFILVSRSPCRLLQDHLYERGHLAAILKMIRAPQAGPPEGFGAVQEGLADAYDDGQLWYTTSDRHIFQNFRVTSECGLPVYAQCVLEAGNDKEQSDIRVGNDVGQRIKTVVPRAIRDRNGTLIENLHETRRIATRTDVSLSVRMLGANTEKRRAPDELSRMFPRIPDTSKEPESGSARIIREAIVHRQLRNRD